MTINRCQNKKCPCYGQELVDRGYGYPVCPSTQQKNKRSTERKEYICMNCKVVFYSTATRKPVCRYCNSRREVIMR